MLVYKYNTEQEAKDAVDLCNKYYGYPKEGCVTTDWCSYRAEQDYFIIIYNDTLKEVLGEPQDA